MDRDFAGRDPHYPKTGDKVRVIEGDHVGQVVEVTDVTGSAFAAARKVQVLAPDGRAVWYWPWNLDGSL